MKAQSKKDAVILMVDDDPEDIFLTRRAFEKADAVKEFHAVSNGREMLDYLRNKGKFADAGINPRPHIVLLDMNMPMMNGIEALAEVRRDPELSDIPVVMFSTSRDRLDVSRSYAVGANSYVTKPSTAAGMRDLVRAISDYWFTISSIPETGHT